ncbi:hypothetical protein [Ancylobacter sp. FA202]|uniref:hypothetical protein n=1 Tax=Ancylobacter sp. FA202 TaxID=1111106 RepID=UPI0003681809|nr:hypothetical protein [Ancylobacter sp. FA202]
MIVFISFRGHQLAVQSRLDKTFGVPTPDIRHTHYERLLRSVRIPRATYVFCDFESLRPWMLQLAAELYRMMTAAGLRCLNDPAMAMSRVELLTTLRREGFNPFGVYHADTDPHPRRFPVFVRNELGHGMPFDTLYEDQESLTAGLAALKKAGMPLRGLLVIELAAERYNETLWAKWGTWCIGGQTVLEHIAVDDTWLVKIGDHAKVTPEIAQDEHDAVLANRYADDLSRAFALGNLEYGRADHAQYNGRTVLFEVNTNPYIGPFKPRSPAIRTETTLFARRRMAECHEAIDTPVGGSVWLPNWRARRPWVWFRPGFVGPPGP